jgi:hypothetical protein
LFLGQQHQNTSSTTNLHTNTHAHTSTRYQAVQPATHKTNSRLDEHLGAQHLHAMGRAIGWYAATAATRARSSGAGPHADAGGRMLTATLVTHPAPPEHKLQHMLFPTPLPRTCVAAGDWHAMPWPMYLPCVKMETRGGAPSGPGWFCSRLCGRCCPWPPLGTFLVWPVS